MLTALKLSKISTSKLARGWNNLVEHLTHAHPSKFCKFIQLTNDIK